jgi:hypothetical protein
MELRSEIKPGRIAHSGQFALTNIARKADVYLIALEWVGVVVKPKNRSARPVRYREMRSIDFEIGL